MTLISPQTEIRLLKVPLEIDNNNQLTFNNKTEQYNYFNSLPHIECDDNTYQRKDNYIRYPGNYDDLIGYNYCMYKNDAFSDKWFYAFITDMTFVSTSMTAVYIKTDVFQTWQFDIEYLETFVEREHVNDDTIGKHTIEEELETGEYICNSHTTDTHMDDLSDYTCILSTSADYLSGDYVSSKKYNGIITGSAYVRCDDSAEVQGVLNGLADKGKIDAVVGLFIAPKVLTGGSSGYTGNVPESNTPISYTSTLTKQTTLNGYTPKNNKLLCYPYNYLYVDNNSGSNAIYRYELFSSSPSFTIECVLTPGCSIRLIPTNYKGASYNDSEGINLGKYPICSYNCDMYTNWLTQNSVDTFLGGKLTTDEVNVGNALFNGLGSTLNLIAGTIAGGASAGLGMSGGFVGGLAGIGNALITRHQHELIPPQTRGNTNAGDVITATGRNTFHYYKMSIKLEYAKIIDKYFSMYGYKVNEVKLPNITGRRNWNFVKTINMNMHGYFPQSDIEELKNMFNRGLTLWHNPSTFLDYSQNNDII